VVLRTGTALRRPSAWFAVPRKGGCFSPAVGWYTCSSSVAWYDPAGRGPTLLEQVYHPAGP
jgi:hypothetical protein